MSYKSQYVTCANREIHVTVWGAENERTLIMWHGLARTGRDFDTIAGALSDRYRVLCPDTVGRGLSQWAKDPSREYSLSFYGEIALDLVKAFDVETMAWLGTSMGGALGIMLAAGPLKGRISHLVINDIGPALSDAAVERILNYAGDPPQFDTMLELEDYLRNVYAPFGEMSAAEWRRLAETSARRTDDGRFTTHYDPRMVDQFRNYPQDFDQWEQYDAIEANTLLLRGAESDLLLFEWAHEMTQRGPKCRLETIQGCGHAPPLNSAEQIDLIAGFLDE